MTVDVALVGCGAWGRNLLRVLEANPKVRVACVADPRAEARAAAAAIAPRAELVVSAEEAIARAGNAVVIAAPCDLHAELAIAALDAGFDVFVEKPLALSAADAERCRLRARAKNAVTMVGHLLRYHPAIARLVELARSGELGALQHVDADRLSVSGSEEASVLWTLGPHDVSVLQALDASAMKQVDVVAPPSGDRALVEVELASGLTAKIRLARTHPTKERKLCVVGSRATATFDDVRAPDRILVTTRECTREIPVDWREPLAAELDHFIDCVLSRSAPITSFEEGFRVVRALAALEFSAGRRHAEQLTKVATFGDSLP